MYAQELFLTVAPDINGSILDSGARKFLFRVGAVPLLLWFLKPSEGFWVSTILDLHIA
jgi:hypothetical protein